MTLYYDPAKDCRGCAHCVCAAGPDDPPQPGYLDDPDYWLVCPAKELAKPSASWVWRVMTLYRHWQKGQLGLWVPHPSEQLARLLVCCDNAINELNNWRQEVAVKKARTK